MGASVASALASGLVIPAHPLALTESRSLDERHQRALTRYYVAAGAGGLAVGVHTTQFAIHDRRVGLYEPVLELAAETARSCRADVLLIAGVVGDVGQAVAEAESAARAGYDAVLLSPARGLDEDESIARARAVAEVLPVIGFYLQEAVGGQPLSLSFWRRLVEISNVVAIKAAPFNRYRTLDVARAVAESGREDLSLYTGNDDAIIADLLAAYHFGNRDISVRGGLLGQWAVWTKAAVRMMEDVVLARGGDGDKLSLLVRRAADLTDANSALFDSANNFAGCIAGIHEVLRRQGLMQGIWCLDPAEGLSPGQAGEISRVCARYRWIQDDDFVAEHLDSWLR